MSVSLALSEIREAPKAVRAMLSCNGAALEALAHRLSELAPRTLLTIARGTSDHAATFFKYSCEISLGIPVASLGPSLATIYQAPLRVNGMASIAISQSGASPDLVALQKAVRERGALTIAVVNDIGSPLAKASNIALDVCAGPELSVAATKSFIVSTALCLSLVARLSGDVQLSAAVAKLPDHLDQSLACDWSAAVKALAEARSLFVVGRGPGLAMAGEAALKLKEMCGLHAEAYSAAELRHGPVTLAGADFPVLVLAAGNDPTPAEIAQRLVRDGVSVFIAGAEIEGAIPLPVARTDHPFTDQISLIASFYVFAEALARRRGRDPDRPKGLEKVTRTV
jgi:glutamine---fructose-6-phosphate transaminase (isomerizing)